MKDGQTITEKGITYAPFKLVGLIGFTALWKQVS